MIATAPKPPSTLLDAMRHFDPETARRYVESIKWPEGPVCPKCGSQNVGDIKSRNGMQQCREKTCRCQFSLTKGTIMEGTHLRLDQWIAAVWMIVNCRNGISSCEIARTIGCKQQSAWHLLHRVRHLLAQESDGTKMGSKFGVVEADTTFVGGSLEHISPWRKDARGLTDAYDNKSAVHAIKDRKSGKIRAHTIPSESPNHVEKLIYDNVAEWSILYTDKSRAYDVFSHRRYQHRTVNHRAGEYVRGKAHVNGLENFFNCLRRGLKGTYIRATADHLQAYVDEQVWRFNYREFSDWNRFDTAMHLIVGKRLTYKALTDGAVR